MSVSDHIRLICMESCSIICKPAPTILASDRDAKTKKELTDIIESQIEKWPDSELTFDPSKTKIVDNRFSWAVPPEIPTVQGELFENHH